MTLINPTIDTIDAHIAGLQGQPAPRDVLKHLLSEAIVNAVAAIYPDRLPEELLGADELARKVGQQDVIKTLRSIVTVSERRRDKEGMPKLLPRGQSL